MRRLNLERMRRHRVPRTGRVVIDRNADDPWAERDVMLGRLRRAYPAQRVDLWVIEDMATLTTWLHYAVRS